MNLIAFRRMSDGSHPPSGTDAEMVVFLRIAAAGHRWHIRGRYGFAEGTATMNDLRDLEEWASRTAVSHAESSMSEIEGKAA